MDESSWKTRPFEEMTDPPFADRVRAFWAYLKAEPCQRDGACEMLSVSGQMCPACRLRLHFWHCTENAEAYEGGPGEIPRADPLMTVIDADEFEAARNDPGWKAFCEDADRYVQRNEP